MNTPLTPIRAEDFTYELPEEKIALFPLEQRDASRLLVYREGNIEHTQFKNLPSYLSSEYTLFFNNTKVIPARLYFQKDSGAWIEIFLLNPLEPTSLVSQAMFVTEGCTWACAIGNLKRIKDDTVLQRTTEINGRQVTLEARLASREKQWISFSWNDSSIAFATLLTYFGVLPLPPYLKREAQETDQKQYQTVYSKHEGAVAAPTAGLHFTPEVLAELDAKGIKHDYLTLHVAGGTFQPIRHENVLEHEMHSEQVIITRENLQHIIDSKKIIAVGTTSMRTLESLYWFGMKLKNNPDAIFRVGKLEPYGYAATEPDEVKEVMNRVLGYMDRKQLHQLTGETEIMIIPGYRFRLCEALVTNFHLPGTTLIMLVAAFIGEDWRRVYDEALERNYRFLSFGDSSLLFRKY